MCIQSLRHVRQSRTSAAIEVPDGCRLGLCRVLALPIDLGALGKIAALLFAFLLAVLPLGAQAQVVWNQFDKHTGIALSNGGLTATTSGSAVYQGIRANAAQNSGKFYFEVTIGANTGTAVIGLGTIYASLGNYVGSVSSGVSYQGSGYIFWGGPAGNADQFINAGALGAGKVLAVAVDLTNHLVWFSVNGGAWNGTMAGNPSAGTGGFLASGVAGYVFPMFASGNPGDNVTANFGASSFSYAIPSGFQAWQTGATPTGSIGGTTTCVGENDGSGTYPTMPSQFRLTAESCNPVMAYDHPSINTLYLTRYTGSRFPICNGTSCQSYAMSQLSVTLNADHADTQYVAAGHLYDLYVVLNGTTPTLGHSPAWPSNALPPWARGVTDGVETNAQSLQIRYEPGPSGLYTAPAGTATYVGTFFATGDGQTSFVSRAYPSLPDAYQAGYFLGFWNADNRIDIEAYASDGTFGWFYANADTTARMVNNNNNNRIFWVDGRGRSPVSCRYDSSLGTIPNNNPAGGTIACILNWLPGMNYVPHANLVSQGGYNSNSTGIPIVSSGSMAAQIGVSNVAAVEYSTPIQTNYFGAQYNGPAWLAFSTLQLHLKM